MPKNLRCLGVNPEKNKLSTSFAIKEMYLACAKNMDKIVFLSNPITINVILIIKGHTEADLEGAFAPLKFAKHMLYNVN